MLILRFAPDAEKNCNQPFLNNMIRLSLSMVHQKCRTSIWMPCTFFGEAQGINEPHLRKGQMGFAFPPKSASSLLVSGKARNLRRLRRIPPICYYLYKSRNQNGTRRGAFSFWWSIGDYYYAKSARSLVNSTRLSVYPLICVFPEILRPSR